MNARQRLLRTATGVLMVTLLGACSANGTTATSDTGTGALSPGASGSGAPGPSGEPIVIAHTAGMTGFMSVFDQPVDRGMQLAIDDINAKGGVLGRPLRLVTTDNASDVGKIQSAAQQAVDQGAALVVTACDYDMGGPAARTANAKNVLAFSCAGSPNFGFKGVGPLSYNISPGSASEGALLAEYAHEKGYRRPFVLVDTSLEYSQVIGDLFAKRWQELTGQAPGKDTFANDDASVESQVGAAKSAGADVIVVSSYPPGGAKIIAEIRTQGLTVPILGAQAFDGTYWLQTVPDLDKMTIPAAGSIYGDDSDAARNAFFKRFQQKFGEAPASANYPLSGYSSVQAFALAAEKAGSVETASVQKELDAFTDVPLLIGPTTYTADCHIPAGRSFEMITYSAGKPTVTGSAKVASIPGGAPC